jgi:septal ring factor EnvC (AmiA/AmiB activator)
MNSKNYRDMVLEYVEKLGEIHTLEDKLIQQNNQSDELKKQLSNLKKETSNLKQQIDNCKGKNK